MQKSDTAWKTAARMAALAEETDDDYEREHFTRLRRPVHAPGQGIEKIVGNEIFKEIWNDRCASLKRYLAKRASIQGVSATRASRRGDHLQRPDGQAPLRASRDARSATGGFLRPRTPVTFACAPNGRLIVTSRYLRAMLAVARSGKCSH